MIVSAQVSGFLILQASRHFLLRFFRPLPTAREDRLLTTRWLQTSSAGVFLPDNGAKSPVAAFLRVPSFSASSTRRPRQGLSTFLSTAVLHRSPPGCFALPPLRRFRARPRLVIKTSLLPRCIRPLSPLCPALTSVFNFSGLCRDFVTSLTPAQPFGSTSFRLCVASFLRRL